MEETEGEVEEALKLRLLMAKTSVKKYEAIERAVSQMEEYMDYFSFMGQTELEDGPTISAISKSASESSK